MRKGVSHHHKFLERFSRKEDYCIGEYYTLNLIIVNSKSSMNQTL